MKNTLMLEELLPFLFEEVEAEWLYHVTYFNRLEGISDNGLQPGSARSIGAPSYDVHAAKGIFLTEQEGVRFWYNKAESFAEHNSDNPYEEGLAPIVLRVDYEGLKTDLQTDELGSEDSRADAYIHAGGIDPEYIEAWDGSSWIPIEDYWDIDTEQAFEIEEDSEDTGEVFYFFKDNNPLQF
jgi:hypothetical protein